MHEVEELLAFCRTPLDAHLARPGDAVQTALALFQRAATEVPAYRAFLRARSIHAEAIDTAAALSTVPTIDKDDYLRRHSLADLCFGGELTGCDTVAVSSGSTGLPTYFPRGLRHEVDVAWRFEQVFRDTFMAHERRTLAVVCFPLGTWVGGMFTAACCRHLAQKNYPLLVVTPGNQPAEIWRAVRELGPAFEQVVLLGYPPFLKEVIDGGGAQGIDWAVTPLKLVLAGEVVSEHWRDIMAERTHAADVSTFCSSLYGTADAGVLGAESTECTQIRRAAKANPILAESLFGERRLPTLVQYDPRERYFECDDGMLVLTADGGTIPLVRYALGDRGGVIPHDDMRARTASLDIDWTHARPLPFVYVFGRAQHSVSFYGANVFVEVVRLGLEHEDVRHAVTGKLVMCVNEDESGNSHLIIDVELAQGLDPTAASAAQLAGHIRDALLSHGAEFAAYVPAARQLPTLQLWPFRHPDHFPVGVKHRYVR